MRHSLILVARRLTSALLAPALLLALWTAPARANNLLDMQIVSRATGLPLQVYVHRGQRYVVGVPGEGYSVRLTNRSGGRVLSVLAVDGINAITGETAATSQSGYVLAPFETAEITGWRKSMEEVARFYFTRLPDSYAARTDRPDNVGVIGVAAYAEYVPPPPVTVVPAPRSDNAARQAAPAAPAAEAAAGTERDLGKLKAEREESRLGTGHGERETAPTRYTEFRRATSQPQEIVTVRYDSRAQLVSQGVIREVPPRRLPDPQPFPARFVPDPRR
jgi:hypothetical protein